MNVILVAATILAIASSEQIGDGTENISNDGNRTSQEEYKFESKNDNNQNGSNSLDAVPGVPGKDYPNLEFIPQTSFTCFDKKPGGYYADIETRCQVFHVCNVGDVKSSFLCPPGSIFNQKYLVCDWWYDFDCDHATDLFSYKESINPEQIDSNLEKDYYRNDENSSFGKDSTFAYQENNSVNDLSLAGTGEGGLAYSRNKSNRRLENSDQNYNQNSKITDQGEDTNSTGKFVSNDNRNEFYRPRLTDGGNYQNENFRNFENGDFYNNQNSDRYNNQNNERYNNQNGDRYNQNGDFPHNLQSAKTNINHQSVESDQNGNKFSDSVPRGFATNYGKIEENNNPDYNPNFRDRNQNQNQNQNRNLNHNHNIETKNRNDFSTSRTGFPSSRNDFTSTENNFPIINHFISSDHTFTTPSLPNFLRKELNYDGENFSAQTTERSENKKAENFQFDGNFQDEGKFRDDTNFQKDTNFQENNDEKINFDEEDFDRQYQEEVDNTILNKKPINFENSDQFDYDSESVSLSSEKPPSKESGQFYSNYYEKSNFHISRGENFEKGSKYEGDDNFDDSGHNSAKSRVNDSRLESNLRPRNFSGGKDFKNKEIGGLIPDLKNNGFLNSGNQARTGSRSFGEIREFATGQENLRSVDDKSDFRQSNEKNNRNEDNYNEENYGRFNYENQSRGKEF